MWDVRTRCSTGTRMGDGVGGAVRAAASAGDWILLPAVQLAAASSITKTNANASFCFLSSLSLTPFKHFFIADPSCVELFIAAVRHSIHAPPGLRRDRDRSLRSLLSRQPQPAHTFGVPVEPPAHQRRAPPAAHRL